jgi:hypothetical protein
MGGEGDLLQGIYKILVGFSWYRKLNNIVRFFAFKKNYVPFQSPTIGVLPVVPQPEIISAIPFVVLFQRYQTNNTFFRKPSPRKLFIHSLHWMEGPWSGNNKGHFFKSE